MKDTELYGKLCFPRVTFLVSLGLVKTCSHRLTALPGGVGDLGTG